MGFVYHNPSCGRCSLMFLFCHHRFIADFACWSGKQGSIPICGNLFEVSCWHIFRKGPWSYVARLSASEVFSFSIDDFSGVSTESREKSCFRIQMFWLVVGEMILGQCIIQRSLIALTWTEDTWSKMHLNDARCCKRPRSWWSSSGSEDPECPCVQCGHGMWG